MTRDEVLAAARDYWTSADPRAKAERNVAMFMAWWDGNRYADIARAAGISSTAVITICERTCRMVAYSFGFKRTPWPQFSDPAGDFIRAWNAEHSLGATPAQSAQNVHEMSDDTTDTDRQRPA